MSGAPGASARTVGDDRDAGRPSDLEDMPGSTVAERFRDVGDHKVDHLRHLDGVTTVSLVGEGVLAQLSRCEQTADALIRRVGAYDPDRIFPAEVTLSAHVFATMRSPDDSADARIAIGMVVRDAWLLGVLLDGRGPAALPVRTISDVSDDPEARRSAQVRAEAMHTALHPYDLPAVLLVLGDPAQGVGLARIAAFEDMYCDVGGKLSGFQARALGWEAMGFGLLLSREPVTLPS